MNIRTDDNDKKKPREQQHGKSLQKNDPQTFTGSGCASGPDRILVSSPPAKAQVTDQSLQQAADKLEAALSKAMKNAGRSGNPSSARAWRLR